MSSCHLHTHTTTCLAIALWLLYITHNADIETVLVFSIFVHMIRLKFTFRLLNSLPFEYNQNKIFHIIPMVCCTTALIIQPRVHCIHFVFVTTPAMTTNILDEKPMQQINYNKSEKSESNDSNRNLSFQFTRLIPQYLCMHTFSSFFREQLKLYEDRCCQAYERYNRIRQQQHTKYEPKMDRMYGIQ